MVILCSSAIAGLGGGEASVGDLWVFYRLFGRQRLWNHCRLSLAMGV